LLQRHYFSYSQTMRKHKKTETRSEETRMDLPEVRDIPGQEHVRPPKMKEFADTTISSDDEEGKGVLDDNDNELSRDVNVSPEEKELLENSVDSMATQDDENWRNARLDNIDEDGESLNEKVDFAGTDLDVPGSEDDDINEELGEEDEENNSYSLGADKD
jgi:hypothetical protein